MGVICEEGSLSVSLPGPMHLQCPLFGHRLLLHPKLCGGLLYLCIQCERGKRNTKKPQKKRKCTWFPNGVLQRQARVAAGLFTHHHGLEAHTDCY